jgi:hypothetical protein
MAAQKATGLGRALAEVENNARSLSDRQSVFESQLLTVPAGPPHKMCGICRRGDAQKADQRQRALRVYRRAGVVAAANIGISPVVGDCS